MVNHDGGEETLRSVESLMKELSREDQLFLVDNGSQDGSGKACVKAFPQIGYLSHEENLTFAEASNRGVIQALAEGYRYVGLLNPDVRVQRGMVDALTDSLIWEVDTAAVSPLILYPDGRRIWFAGGKIHWLFGWMSHVNQGRVWQRSLVSWLPSDYLTGCCWLSPAEAWRRVGLLDPSYGMYAEDADWSLRATHAGLNLRVTTNAKLVHNISRSSGGGRNPFKMWYRTRATRLFFHRHTPRGILRLAQPVFARLFAVFYSIFLLLDAGRASARSYLAAWMIKTGDRVPWPPSQKTGGS